MIEDLARILPFSQSALAVGFVVFLRVGAAMAVLPAFGERAVPERIRLALALGFTAIVGPAVAGQIAGAFHPVRYMFTEVIVGLGIGIVVRLFVLALQMAGSIAAQSTSLAQIFGGANADPQPAMGHILLIAGLALAVMAGLHVRLAALFVLSYDVFPPGHWPDPTLFSQWGIGRVAHAFYLAFTLAAPFVIASLIYNVALGVINRAMPQLMVAFVGAPAITAGGLVLLLLVAPILLSLWLAAFNAFLATPF